MEQGGQNLLARVEESKALPASERKTKLEMWGQQACQVDVRAMLSNTPFWGLQGIITSLHRGQYAGNKDGYDLFRLSSNVPCQVLVALHGLGIVWGDVKPDNFVCRGDKLVAVDFGSSCVETGTVAQRELGADADTSFTPRPNDQFAWSVQYAAPERAKCDQMGVACVARRSQVCFRRTLAGSSWAAGIFGWC